MKVWQIACGEAGRYYDDLFLDHDIMFLGPGELGRYEDAKHRGLVNDGLLTRPHYGRIRSLVRDVQADDIILLRKGYRVVSVGLAVEGSYDWNDALDDVYGWDLRHSRRVAWQRHLEADLSRIQAEREVFAGRKQIPTFTRVSDQQVLRPIEHLFTRCKQRQLRTSPETSPVLGLDELGQRLFSAGLPNNSVDQVLGAIDRQRRLATWYAAQKHDSGRPTEHEVVAHMVLPILLALGWSEQLLAVEWKSIDLAGFHQTPTKAESCVLVCEVKRGGSGMQEVWRQAHGYVEKLKLRSCGTILVTEGARFYLYTKSAGRWSEVPTGFFNVEKIRENHVAPRGTDAVKTLMDLTPMRMMRT